MLLRRHHHQVKGEDLPLPDPEEVPKEVEQVEEPVEEPEAVPVSEAPRRRGRPRKNQ